MDLQSFGSFNFGNFGTPNLGVPKQMTFGCIAPVAKHKEYYKEEGVNFPQVQVVVSLVSSCMFVARLCIKSASTTH